MTTLYPTSKELSGDKDMPAREMEVSVPFLRVRGLAKHFGGVQALKGVDLDVFQGQVHGLVGANGAGKSTLIRILAGVHAPDMGTISIDGKPVEIADPLQARQLGLSFIHQELNLVPKFNALQNMTLGLPKATRAGLIDWKAVKREVEGAAVRVGINFPLDVPVETLSVAEQWLISIGRALVHKARLIAMDEPTASLSAEESSRLFQIIRELSADGIAILYVSHRLDEILELCDRVTVFKDGSRVMTANRQAVTKDALVRAIVGGEVSAVPEISSHTTSSPVVLDVRGLSRGSVVRQAFFQLHAGEVLGLAGLVGAGRTELARLIFGADNPDSGEVWLDGKPWRCRSPYDAVRHGIAFVPEERRSQGLVLDKSVAFNINLTSLRPLRLLNWFPMISLGRGASRAKSIVERLQVKTPSVDTPIHELSGGNQQKVVIGKWLTRHVRVLMLDEPSRGVDVGARGEIHKIIKELADSGTGIIVISSEAEELPGLCDRVLVMVEGRIAGELTGSEITKEAILRLSYAHGHRTDEES
jgi:ribose transport system ATP-binding protein